MRMHDRCVPVTLDMLCKGNVGKDVKVDKEDWVESKEMRHIQEAVLNYTVLLNAIWPLDYARLVITRILVESSWGVVAGGVASHRHPRKRKGASPSRRPLGVPATLIEPLNGVTTH